SIEVFFLMHCLPDGLIPLVRERSSFFPPRKKEPKSRLKNLRFLRISLRSVAAFRVSHGAR
ncbi:MAG: hypothetical protein IJF15_01055, partial [Oscillospiraceae bacterium]|nr:hypothetical protein [Oscillospiraceae bacterium]